MSPSTTKASGQGIRCKYRSNNMLPYPDKCNATLICGDSECAIVLIDNCVDIEKVPWSRISFNLRAKP
jgi:hypothetical protein